MSGIINTTGAKSGVIGTTSAPAVGTGTDGYVLTATGAGVDPAWEAATGGIKAFQQWRLTSGKNSISTVSHVEANLSEVSGGLNSNVSLSSGTFSFGITGVYWLLGNFNCSYDNQVRYVSMEIRTTTDNSTYTSVAVGHGNRFDPGGADVYTAGAVNVLFDVTSTTNCKARFYVYAEAASNFFGNSTENRTYFTFLRLGDT